jgi:NADPH-dependent F420 reductase
MNKEKTTIAILGGTGALGSALAKKWAQNGYTVIVGSRKKEKAETTAIELNKEIGSELIKGLDLIEASKNCNLAVMAVPYSSHQMTLDAVKINLIGKIIIDTTVPLQGNVTKVSLPKKGSAALEAQIFLGDKVKVVSALQNIGSHLIGSDKNIDAEVLVTGNDREAVQLVRELINDLGLTSWDAGSIENSAAAEALTSILIFINKRHKLKSSGIKITSH